MNLPEFQMITLRHFYSLSNVWIDWLLMLSSDVTTYLLWFMQKVKHNFILANKEISSGNVYITLKLSTACSTLSKSVVIQ